MCNRHIRVIFKNTTKRVNNSKASLLMHVLKSTTHDAKIKRQKPLIAKLLLQQFLHILKHARKKHPWLDY